VKVRVSTYLMVGSAPDADQFTCGLEDVPARLRPLLATLPAETQGEVRLGLTAAMPEALRAHGTWVYSSGPLMVRVARADT
jgi:hypothetical protein